MTGLCERSVPQIPWARRIVVVHAASWGAHLSRPPEGHRGTEAGTQADGGGRSPPPHRPGGHGQASRLKRCGRFAEVMDEVDGVEPVPDFGHIHARGQGCLKTKEDFQEALDGYLQLHPGRLHCHFSCISTPIRVRSDIFYWKQRNRTSHSLPNASAIAVGSSP